MTWLDTIILLPLLIGLAIGIKKGLIIELTAVVSIFVAFSCAQLWGATVAVWMMQQFAWTEAVCSVVAYSLLFLLVYLALYLLAKLLSKLFKAIKLGWLNRTLGAIFGTAKWAIIMVFVVMCVHRLDMQYHFMKDKLIERSPVYSAIAPRSEQIWEKVRDKATQLINQQKEEKTEQK